MDTFYRKEPEMEEQQIKTEKSELADRLPGTVITIIFILIELAFVLTLVWTKLVPGNLLLVGAIALIVLAALIGIMVYRTRRRVSFTIGTVIAVLISVLMLFAAVYLGMTKNTLDKITGIKTQLSEVAVFVRTDDAAQSLQDAKDYTFGILESLDRNNTDAAVNELESELGSGIEISEYPGLTALVDALLGETVDAIILNKAYLDVIEEIEGYEALESELRELVSKTVEVEIPTKNQDSDSSVSDNAAESPAENPENVYSIYLGGSDTRGALNTIGRNDVNIIVTFNTKTREMLILSTPRDYFVPLSVSGGARDKLTHAGIYGFDVSRETLEMLYEADIDYTFRVNFTGFEDIVDALGGITVYSDYAFTNQNGGSYSFNQGENYLNGSQALAFCRERYAFAAGDIQRGKNQMAVIKGIINKATSPSILTNYTGLLASLEGCFQTDIPYDLVAELVREQLSDSTPWHIVSYNVTGTGDSQIPYSMSQYAYVMWPDESTVAYAKELMRQVRDGEAISEN